MGLVMNASCETQVFKVFGNVFTLKPGQIKMFQDNISQEIAISRRSFGLVQLPEEFTDPEFARSEEGKKLLLAKKAEGIQNRVQYLKTIVYNLQVSLKNDLDKANLKVDPRALASEGEIAAMEELAKYQDNEEDEKHKKLERVKELEKKLGKAEK
jgi:hypothetical protein